MLGDSIRRRRGAPRAGRDAAGREAVEARTEAEERTARKARPERARPPFPWGPFALVTLLTAALLFAGGYLFASFVLYPPVEASGASVTVPDLTGLSDGEARGRLQQAGFTPGNVTPLPHPDAAAGIVLAQAPLAGQGARPDARVDYAVSAGAPRARVPDLVGFPAGTARDVLERAGLRVEVREVADPTPPGRVVEVSPPPGTEGELPITVTLTVSAGPPPDTVAAPDTAAGPPPPVIVPPLR